MMTIKEKVADQISKAGPRVEDIVVGKLAETEINRRATMIEQAVGRLDSLNKDLRKKDRDDQEHYSGGVKVTSMSKQRFEEIGKFKESISRLEKAVEDCLANNDYEQYSKLQEVINKSNAIGDKKESSGESKE